MHAVPSGNGDSGLSDRRDEFYGYNCQRLAHNYYPEHLWHNGRKIMLGANRDTLLGDYAPFLIQEKVLQFIERNRDGPFFCYVPNVIPHAELFAPDEYMDLYRGKFLPEKVYHGCDPGCEGYKTGGYGTQEEAHAAFAAMIHILDEHIGQIMDKVEELGLSGNTIIMFSSDNGPHLEGGADPDYFNSNGPFKGYKRDLYEGGIRVPLLVRWPGEVKAGTRTGHISAFWDIMPTLSQLAGATAPENIDGISFLPTLLGETGQQEHGYLYWEFYEMGGRRALRKDDWKAVQYDISNHPEAPLMLFNLLDDPGEKQDVSSLHPELVREMEQLMEQAHTDSGVFTKNEK
jgi:arylsulfatase A